MMGHLFESRNNHDQKTNEWGDKQSQMTEEKILDVQKQPTDISNNKNEQISN